MNSEIRKRARHLFMPPAGSEKKPAISGMGPATPRAPKRSAITRGLEAWLARETLVWQKSFSKTLNVSYNCRNLQNGNADKTAIIFEAADGQPTKASYREPHEKVCKFANGLRSLGINKGDRVDIYMSMSVDSVPAMQACARIGVTHSVVFGGFSAKLLRERIMDPELGDTEHPLFILYTSGPTGAPTGGRTPAAATCCGPRLR